ncbi:MAG: cell division protein FtsZ, partial [Hydrococcus sp. RM1_1_31]|nr:cell division protein FtsZ [Hydrococcus sp. RM1_1_31]
NAAADIVYEIVDPNANIIFGAVIDEKLQGEIRITVIATGFSAENQATGGKGVVRPANPTTSTQPNPEPEPKQSGGLDIPPFLQKRRFQR